MDPRFIRFLAVGCLNAAFGYSVFAVLTWLGLLYPVSIGLATICGVLFNFHSTGRLVFGSSTASLLPRFVMVYTVVYAANVLSVAVLIAWGANTYLANALALPAMALLAFGLQRRFVFRDKS